MNESLLRGRHILLVEDEYFIADAMKRGLEGAGAYVVGPAASVRDALSLLDARAVDGAILDISLTDEKVFAVADALVARGIPFLFATGYSGSDLPSDWRQIARYEKPVEIAVIGRALFSNEVA